MLFSHEHVTAKNKNMGSKNVSGTRKADKMGFKGV